MSEATDTASAPAPVAAEFERWLEDFGSQYEAALERFVRSKRREYAERKPLYVNRRLANADEFVAWAKSQGFKTTLPPEDIHVTVAFSRDPVDWDAAGDSIDRVRFSEGERRVEPLGDKGAVVMFFEAEELRKRWQEFRDAGASWDYDEYSPHLTITYEKPEGLDLGRVEPFRGALEFGPERFEELDDEWSEKVKESAQADPQRLRDYSAIAERLDRIEAESMGELRGALASAGEEFLAFARRALAESPQSPEWVNSIEFDPGAEFSAAVDRMFQRAWAFARDQAFEREYADPPDLGRLPQSAQRYFRTKRFWVTGLVGKDLTRQAQGILLAGMKSGASVDTIAARLGELMDDATEARLRTIVRTNVTDAYNQGVLVDMRSEEMRGIVKAVEYVAVLDDRTTEVCEYLDGTVFRLHDPRLDALNPPNHFNCRSVLSPVVEGQRVLRSSYITAAKFRRARSLIPPGFGGTK